MSTLTIGCIRRPVCYGFTGSPDSLPERKYIQSESNLHENTVCCQTDPSPVPPPIPPITDIHIWRYAADPATAQNTVQLEILNPVYDPTADLLFPTTTAEGAGTRLFFDRSKGAYRAGTVTGPQWNDANRGVGSVAMGVDSTASGLRSVVVGGDNNTANALEAAVVGGEFNTASGDYSFIGGGENNQATGVRSTIGGGNGQLASGLRSTIGGGSVNIASGINSTVGGGSANNSGGSFPPFPLGGPIFDFTTIGGGNTNTAWATNATIGGGVGNHAFGTNSTIGGGNTNNILVGAVSGTIAGGSANFIGDMTDLTIQPNAATIAGGSGNFVRNHLDFIGGGQGNETFAGHKTFPFTSANVICGGTDNEIGHIAIPPNVPENNPSFCNILGGGANRLGALAPNDVTYSTIGGGNLVFLDANYSVIGGGNGNRINPPTVAPNPVASNDFGVIGGGEANWIGFAGIPDIPAGTHNTVAGGSKNTIFNGNFVTIAGGESNKTTGTGTSNHSTVSGGLNNEILTTGIGLDSSSSTIVGGSNGIITDSINAGILGGDNCNINAGANFSFAMGDDANVAVGHNHAMVVSLTAAGTASTATNQYMMGFQAAPGAGTQGLYWQGWPTGLLGGAVVVTGAGQVGEAVSSQLYKKNIVSVDAKTADLAISALRPVHFEMKATNQPDFGLIAEEVYDIIPEAVTLDQEGKPKGLRLDPIVSLLIKQVQELKQQVAILQQQQQEQ